jgi:hypothetical protein
LPIVHFVDSCGVDFLLMQSLWLSWVLSRRAEDSECEKGCVGKRSTEDASASMQAPYTKNPLVEVATAHEIAAHNIALVPFWSRRSHRGQLLGDAIKFKIKADDGRPRAFDVTPCDSDALTSCSGDSGYDRILCSCAVHCTVADMWAWPYMSAVTNAEDPYVVVTATAAASNVQLLQCRLIEVTALLVFHEMVVLG